MTDTQRKEIHRLRQAGTGYVKIAQTLELSPNTVKAYCRRNGLASTRSVKDSATLSAPGTQAENNSSRTGRINLISAANRGNCSAAEGTGTLDFTGLLAKDAAPRVNLVFAEQTDEKAIHEVLGMLLRENCCDE